MKTWKFVFSGDKRWLILRKWKHTITVFGLPDGVRALNACVIFVEALNGCPITEANIDNDPFILTDNVITFRQGKYKSINCPLGEKITVEKMTKISKFLFPENLWLQKLLSYWQNPIKQ